MIELVKVSLFLFVCLANESCQMHQDVKAHNLVAFAVVTNNYCFIGIEFKRTSIYRLPE